MDLDKMSNKSNFFLNIKYAMVAQLISLVSSVLTTLLFPRILGIADFGFWQLFVFYSGFAGVFHFGLNDGIYLKNGGKDYQELDFNRIGSQLKLSLLIQLIISAFIIITAISTISESNRLFVIIAFSLYIIIFNTHGFLGLILQTTNQAHSLARSIILDKMIFLVLILLSIIFSIENLRIFIFIFFIGKLCSLFYIMSLGRKIIFSKTIKFKLNLINFYYDMKIGIFLMIANITSTLILGFGKFLVDFRWDIITFGQVSFAISLTTIVLLFINQIGLVIFPALSSLDDQNQKKYFSFIQIFLSLFLPFTYLTYYLLEFILNFWLPNINQSLLYLILFLPVCIFNSRMSLLSTTFLKAMRKEKALLFINVLFSTLSLILTLIAAYLLNNLILVLLSLIFSTWIRNVVSEIYLSKILNEKCLSFILKDAFIAVIFVLVTWFTSSIISGIIILCISLVNIYVNKQKLFELILIYKK